MPDPRRIVVPPQSGRSIHVKRGDLIRIIDPQGQQVADLWAFATGDQLDWLSTSQTRDITEQLFPGIGDHFYSAAAKPMLTLVENASPGPHDMLYPAPATARFTSAPVFPTTRTAGTI
nr:urea carboxylase-associated family protein [Mesorhizobium sp. NZP2077]